MAPLDDRAAARRVLDRFSFGPRPGELDAAVARGVIATVDALLSTTADPGSAATHPLPSAPSPPPRPRATRHHGPPTPQR